MIFTLLLSVPSVLLSNWRHLSAVVCHYTRGMHIDFKCISSPFMFWGSFRRCASISTPKKIVISLTFHWQHSLNMQLLKITDGKACF